MECRLIQPASSFEVGIGLEQSVILALYVGESFVEAQVSENNKQLYFTRWYLGKDSLKTGIQKFLQENHIQKIDKAVVASRFLEKIFSYRLGGSVAIVTTKGFENWASLRQPPLQKVGPLSSPELHFSVHERCNAHGQIEVALADAEITELIEKLKAKQAKRVCIHFMNAHANPANQNKLQEALLAEKFEVFIPTHCEHNVDEIRHWRRNTMNASLSGTFEEIQEEIQEGLNGFLPENTAVSFLCAEGREFQNEKEYRTTSLWGAHRAWASGLSQKIKEPFHILSFGLEQFSLLTPGQTQYHWQSPWGLVHAPQVAGRCLKMQPTTAIEISPWRELYFSRNVVGYEPGPMFLGRGQIPTMLDLWAEQIQGVRGIDERKSPAGIQKFKNQIWTLNKVTHTPKESLEALHQELQQIAIKRLTLEIGMTCQHKKIICMGPLASLFVPSLAKNLPHLKFETLPETETSFLLTQGASNVL